MLSIKKLKIKTRQPILNDFSYEFNKKNLYGIIATNGAGKTTFFRAIMGLIKIEDGSIKLNNQPLNSQKRNIFYFETSDWFDKNMTGLDYLIFIKQEWHSDKRIDEFVNFWGMEDYIKLPIKKYSLGMKQRLLISIYQMSDAEYMLMDEITNGLDENSRSQFFDVLKTLVTTNKLIILSSHYKEDILPYCDYLMTLENQIMKVEQL